MNETERIAKLFTELYNGNPWIDVNLMETLQSISAEKAAKKISPGRNSIWQIVNHLVNWRLNVLRRVKGETADSPAENYFYEVNDTSEDAWKTTLNKLENSHRDWQQFLRNFDENNFANIYPANQTSWYEHIHGILQHDAYHLGQIVLLSKLL